MALPIIPNIAKGRFARYCDLPETNDALVWALWAGSETENNIKDADTVAALQALALNEATFTGYSRQTATGVTVTVDDTNDRVDVDAADPQWSPTSAEALTTITANYDSDTTGGTDSGIIPIFADTFALTTATTGTLGYTVASGGFGRAA